jgi:hypothetical protein
MLVGVQGGGKSLAAKVIAREWALPLLKLDAGRLYDTYVGESEKYLRPAFATAESMALAVLWIDEIEKDIVPSPVRTRTAGSAGACSAHSSPGCRRSAPTCSWSPPSTTCPQRARARDLAKLLVSATYMERRGVEQSGSSSGS